MKNIIAAALFSATFLTPVFADQIPLSSKLSEVTVYPRGAEITRLASGMIEGGDHVIVVNDLPGEIVNNSVRVAGSSSTSLEIGSVDVRQVYLAGRDHSSERVRIEKLIEAHNDEINLLGLQSNNANTVRAMLQAIAGQAVLPRREEKNTDVISANELSALLSLSGEKFEEISQITEKARIRQRELSREIEELRQQLNQLAPTQEIRTLVSINISAANAGDSEIRIRYNVDNAGWTPHYDAKLILGSEGKDSSVKIVRRANVQQSTTEKWENVALTLSTARPTANTQAPTLSPYILSEYQQFLSRAKESQKRSRIAQDLALESPVVHKQVALGRTVKPRKKLEFKDVAEQLSGFLAEYKISEPVSVSNAGTQKDVVIGASVMPAKVSSLAVPKIDPNAYLTAQFKLKGKAPWLPGTVMLSRDQVFLGKTKLPLLNPGQDYSLGFGRDEFVKVEQVQVTDKKGESGFISAVNVEERKYVTTVSNLHDFPFRIIVKDQIPYGTHEDIKVELLPKSAKPTIKDVDKKRGILAWENVVDAGATQTIEFGYKVSWPKEMNITPVR